jgi:phosphoenolpyruvate carboxykinase (ATP)
MAKAYGTPSGDLTDSGLCPSGDVHWNLPADSLIDLAVSREEGVLSAHGALVTETGERTGRSPNDKFIVDEPSTSSDVNWGDVNISTDADTFARLKTKVIAYLDSCDSLFVQDLFCGAEPSEALPIRLRTQYVHSSFYRTIINT